METAGKRSHFSQSLEYRISEALKGNGFDDLERCLAEDDSVHVVSRYDKHVLINLDTLIQKELDQKNFTNVALLLRCLLLYNKLDRNSVLRLMRDGVLSKMAKWFKQVIELHTKDKSSQSAVIVVFGYFFEAISMFAGFNKEGNTLVIGSLFYILCDLVVHPMVDFFVQLDAINKINMLLNPANQLVKKQLSNAEETKQLMKVWGRHLPYAGDYELQLGLTEALCRLTKEKVRLELSKQWFAMEFIVTAFKAIKDSDFETDCRKFLNTVNGILGEKRSVITFPCIAVYLEDYEEDLWETISLPENIIVEYSVEVRSKMQVVMITMLSPVSSAKKNGNRVTIHFDKSFDILTALGNVFGKAKLKLMALNSRMQEKASRHRTKRCHSEPEMIEKRSRKHARMEKRGHSEGERSPLHSMKQKQTKVKMSDSTPSLVMTKTPILEKTSVSMRNIIHCSAGMKATPIYTGAEDAAQDCNATRVKDITTPEGSNVTASDMLNETRQNFRTDVSKNNVEETKKTNVTECGAATKNKCKPVEFPAVKIREDQKLTLSPVIEESINQASYNKTSVTIDLPEADGVMLNNTMKPTSSITPDHHGTFTKEDARSDQAKETTVGSSNAGARPKEGTSMTSIVVIEKLVQYQLEKSISHLEGHRSDTLSEEKGTSSGQSHMETKSVWSQHKQKATNANFTDKMIEPKGMEALNPVATLPRQKQKLPTTADNATSSEVEDERIINKYMVQKVPASLEPIKAPNTKSVIMSIAGKYNDLGKRISFKPTKKIYEFQSDKVPSKETALDVEREHFGLTVSQKPPKRSYVYDFNSGEEEDTSETTAADSKKRQRKSKRHGTNKMNKTGNMSAKQSGKNVNKFGKRLFSETESDALTDAKSDVSWIMKSSEKKKPKLKGYSSSKININETFLASTPASSTIRKRGTQKNAPSVTADRIPLMNATIKPKESRSGGTDGKLASDRRFVQGKRQLKSQLSRQMDSRSSDDESGSKRKGGMPKGKYPATRNPPQPRRPRRAAAKKAVYKDVSDDEIENDQLLETEEYETASHKVIPLETSLSKNRGNKSRVDENDLTHAASPETPSSIEKPRSENYLPAGIVEIYNRPLTASPMPSLAEKSLSLGSISPGYVESPALSLVVPTNSLSNDSQGSPIAQESPESMMNTLSQLVGGIDEDSMLQSETSPEASQASQQTFTRRLYQPSRLTNLNTPTEKCSYAPEPLLNTPPSTSAKKSLQYKQARRAAFDRSRKCSTQPSERQSSEHAIYDEMNETICSRQSTLKPKKLLNSAAVAMVFNTADDVSSDDVSSDELSLDADMEEIVNDDSIAISLKNFSTNIVKITKEKYDKIEAYTKNSLRVTENEMSKLWGQMRHRRIQKIKRMQKILLDELQNANEETKLLKEMENEMLNFWKKQEKSFKTFRIKQEERLKRMQSLFVESQHQSEYEERNMIENGTQTLREELKVYQDRLLNEAQREELNQVRQTLEATFTASYI
ncbi:uncharacterized protein LOC116941658 isoform X2 [Petromyzon marinus]|uniref:Synaptonemal complex protein 2-like isoform X2 n=1 Tax=Petromyzon marinus TaxID=7757 RepID=A0AAJ7T087_PETMA|nr:synaptonemal complex protein 2-like isoform X2 [Petromyzon marinus]